MSPPGRPKGEQHRRAKHDGIHVHRPGAPTRPASFSLRQRLGSFRHAGRGLARLVSQEHNARVHLALACAVLALGGWLGLRPGDWRWLVAAIAAVWAAEAFNTALERLCDRVSMDWHPLARDAKDMAAAAVLLTSAGAALVGLLTLWPYFAG